MKYTIYSVLFTALFGQDVFEGYTLFTPGGGGSDCPYVFNYGAKSVWTV